MSLREKPMTRRTREGSCHLALCLGAAYNLVSPPGTADKQHCSPRTQGWTPLSCPSKPAGHLQGITPANSLFWSRPTARFSLLVHSSPSADTHAGLSPSFKIETSPWPLAPPPPYYSLNLFSHVPWHLLWVRFLPHHSWRCSTRRRPCQSRGTPDVSSHVKCALLLEHSCFRQLLTEGQERNETAWVWGEPLAWPAWPLLPSLWGPRLPSGNLLVHVEAYEKCRVSGPTRGLLSQNVHSVWPTGESYAH